MNESQKLKVNYTLEIADHDGYCSGNECQYSQQYLNTIIYIDTDYVDTYNIDNEDNWYFYEKFLDFPEILSGSRCCHQSDECYDNNLNCHEVRITINNIVNLSN